MKNRLKDLREDHDLTQQMVADQIGITQRKKITLHAAGAGGEGDCSFTKRQTDEMWEEFPVGVAIRQEIFGLFFCRFFSIRRQWKICRYYQQTQPFFM